ncbi:MAG: PH domain-containing protein [Synergistaceae bacterium]|nr:PH domain-containing protein [Synergistaceae bacterium]
MEQKSKVTVFRPSWKNFFLLYLLVFIISALMIYISFGSLFRAGWLAKAWLKNGLYILGFAGILYIFVKIIYIRLDECFTVKEDEVAMEHGILNKKSTEVGIMQIRSIQVQQRIWQRLFDIGDIYIASAGTEGYEIIAHGINKPHEIRDMLQAIMRAAPVTPDKDSNQE